MLKVSNMGSGARELTDDRVWAVQLPPMLQDKGPCTVTVVYGGIQAVNSIEYNGTVTKIWCETNIPIQGCSTEVNAGQGSYGGFSELFVVDMNVGQLASEEPFRYTTPYPTTFRCAGGLPNTIVMQAMSLPHSNTPAGTFTPQYLIASDSSINPQIEFHLAIVFDRSKDIPK